MRNGAVRFAGRRYRRDKRAVIVIRKRFLYAFEFGGAVLGEVLFAYRAVVVRDVALFKAGRVGRRDEIAELVARRDRDFDRAVL